MTSDDRRFDEAIARFDTANREDPNQEVFQGQKYPKELLYAQRMTQWLERLAPRPSETLQLAARCQQLCRWIIPRSQYPPGRDGYMQWRKTLANFHAERAGAILREVGYDGATIGRVQALLRKERLKLDPETQLLEDVIGLVFLENYFAEFAKQHDEPKLLTILRKTWAKMSPRGRQAALGLDLPPAARVLVEKAQEQ
jgi:hypothetical protein